MGAAHCQRVTLTTRLPVQGRGRGKRDMIAVSAAPLLRTPDRRTRRQQVEQIGLKGGGGARYLDEPRAAP